MNYIYMDTHMEKNGAWGASPICSSCVSTEGLLKRGFAACKDCAPVRRKRSGRHLQEHMLDAFHSPLSDND